MTERFTKDAFEKVLSENGREWECYFEKGEFRYRMRFGDNANIFVSSSIDESKVAKPKGSDSIRVYAMYNGKYLSKTQRWVTRVIGWEQRLAKALRETRNMITDLDANPRCPKCGSIMVIRKGVHGEFWGCTKFPNCRGTRNRPAEEDVNRLLKIL